MYYPGLAASHVVPFAQPVYHSPLAHSVVAPVVQAPQPAAIRGESRVEYVPYQRNVIEYEEEERKYTVKVPKISQVTDYYPQEYQKEYIPHYKVEYEEVERPVKVHRAPAPVYPAYAPTYSYAQAPLYASSYVPAYAPATTFTHSFAAPLAHSIVRPQLTASFAYPYRYY